MLAKIFDKEEVARRFLFTIVLLLAAAGAFAASFTFSRFQGAFQGFASDVASALPLESSVGLNWSDAYIGQLLDVPPHFGVGVTVGAANIVKRSHQRTWGSPTQWWVRTALGRQPGARTEHDRAQRIPITLVSALSVPANESDAQKHPFHWAFS